MEKFKLRSYLAPLKFPSDWRRCGDKKMTEMQCISREDIVAKLKAWRVGTVSEHEVLDWASQSYFPGETEFDDWENDSSVSNEVMSELDSLDMNMVLREDIPIHLSFLGTPSGQFDVGYAKWQEAMANIDFKARQKNLKGHPVYGPFCK